MALLLVPACYSPSFLDGKLACSDGGACPSGFSCHPADLRCWRDGAGDAGASRVPDATTPNLDACHRVSTVPGCQSQVTPPATCDPVCQGGCGCNQRCSAMFDGTLGCLPSLGEKKPMESCTLSEPGTPTQTDNCAAGNICLRPAGAGSSQDFCFAICRSDADCSGLPCVSRQITMSTKSVKVCDLPSSSCDPIAGDGDAGGCEMMDGNRPYCFLVASSTPGMGRTVCEYAAGAKTSADCVSSRDCFARFTCPPKPLVGGGFCHRVCDPAQPNAICTAPSICQAWGLKYGYCVSPP